MSFGGDLHRQSGVRDGEARQAAPIQPIVMEKFAGICLSGAGSGTIS
jgi:hypothetical protein